MASASSGTIGASENCGSGSPLGRPRCDITMTLAPASARDLMVPAEARMRPRSVMVPSSIGTLRSLRTSTVWPAKMPASSNVLMSPFR